MPAHTKQMDERGVTPAEGGTRSTDSGDADREEGGAQAPGLGLDALRVTGSDCCDPQGGVTNRSMFVEHLQPRSDREGVASTASTSRRVRRQCFRHRTSAVTVATSAFFSSSALAFYLVRRYRMHNESSPDLCESYDSWVQSGVSVLACWILYESCLAISMRIAPLYHLDSGRTPLRYINRVVRMSCAAYLVSSCFSVLIEKSSRSEPFPQLVCSLPALFAIHSGAFSVYLLVGVLSSRTTRSERLVPLSFVLLDVLEYVSLSDAAAPRVFVPIRCLLAVATTACCSTPEGTCAGETTGSGAPTAATPPGESEIPSTHAVRGYDPTRPPNRILVTSVVFAFCSSQFVHALPCSIYGECSETRVARFVSTRIVVLLCVCTVNLFELIAGSVVRSYEELRNASSKIDREKKMIMRYIFHEIRGPLNEISIILDACSRVVPHREEPGNESEPPGPMSNRSAGSSHMRIGSYMLCASPMTAALPSGEGEARDIEYRISGNEATILNSALSRTSEILAESSLLHSFHNKESNVGSAVFRPRKMLEDIARLYEYQFGVKKVGFSHRFKSELGDVFLRGDAALIRIVVCNYVNRAVQCTPQRGNVRIDIRVYNRGRKRWVKTPTSRVHPTAANGSPNAANVAALLVEVTDDGYGFKKEDSEAIFEPFSSVATGGNDAVYSGYGMGLAICKSIAAALGGTVEAHSDGQGRGACFRLRVEGLQYFTLAEMESGSVRSRVELEDSNYGNSIRVSSTRTDPISSYEHRHLSATTEEAPTRAGAETVGRASEAIDTRVYMMDTIHGRTEGLSSGAHREAVAGGTSTDHSAVSDKVRRRIPTQNVGMRIQIPPQSARLPPLEEKPGGAAPEGGGREWEVVLGGMDVVLVEDSITTMSALKRLVRNMGARNTECCADGSIAVKAYEKVILSGRVFDLVITDLNMPNMGGIEMTSLLRGRGYIGPIIGVSAHAIEEDKSKMLESGMDVVLSKPINKSILSSACRLAIEQASARGFVFSDLNETAVSSESYVCSQSSSGGTRVQDDPEASKGVGGDIAAQGAATCFPSGMRRGELERSVAGRTGRFICAREPVSHSSHGCSGGLGHQETGRVYSKKRLPPLSGPSSSCSMLVPASAARETAMRSVTAIDHLPDTPSSPLQ